jgi:DNA-binding transcriptional LysR family regulator
LREVFLGDKIFFAGVSPDAARSVMNLNRIKLFTIVARQLNLTKAARDLRVSQSSISHQLALLQKDYGVKLYKTAGRGIELTTEGQRFYSKVEPPLKELERVESQLRKSRENQPEILNVGGSYGLSMGLLPSLLADFQKQHPHVQLCLRTGHRPALEQLVLKGDVDIAVMLIAGNYSSSLVVEPFGVEKLVAFVSVDHPFARKSKLTLRELLESPLVISGDQLSTTNIKTILSELEHKGYQPRVTAFYDSPDAVKVAVKKRTGVGLLYRKALATQDIRKENLRILKVEGLKRYAHSFIVYHKDRPLSSSARQFLELLRRRRRQAPPD